MIAYCWRSGFIGFGRKAPKGTITIAEGKPKELRAAVTVRARMAYPKKRGGKSLGLLVPGVPEAPGDNEALEAISKFKLWVRKERTKV